MFLVSHKSARSRVALQEGTLLAWVVVHSHREHRQREKKGIDAMRAEMGSPKKHRGSRTKLCIRLRDCCGREMVSATLYSLLLGDIVECGPRGVL